MESKNRLPTLHGLLPRSNSLVSNYKAYNTRVIALSNNGDVIALSAEDIVRVMQQAGLSDEQILELGTDLRNALASSGAAQIQVGEVVEAIFAVRGNYLHVSSYHRGSFIFNSETGREQ